MKDRREEQIQAYAKWIREFGWAWFATLKLTSGIPSERRANRLFTEWIAGLKAQEGGPNFRWIRVLEKGMTGNNFHFHVLVGGLKNRRAVWQRNWDDAGGQALIERYDPTREGVLYTLKTMGDEGDIDIAFSGLEGKRKP